MGLVSVTASNLDQSIAGDIVGIGGYWRTMSSRSFRVGRSVTGLGLFAIKAIKRGAYIATYRGRRISTEEADRRAAQLHVRGEQAMDDRRVAAMECGTLHQPLVSAECEACGSQGQDRDYRIASNRAW
jgi:hypothetical protein